MEKCKKCGKIHPYGIGDCVKAEEHAKTLNEFGTHDEKRGVHRKMSTPSTN